MMVRVRGGFLLPIDQPPKEAHVELTTECNLNCSICYRRSWNLKPGFMDPTTFTRLLDDLREVGVRSIWLDGFGEPTFHPEFEELVRVASRNFELNLVTNGTLIESKVVKVAELFSNIFVSVDSVDPDTYASVRGFDVRKVGEGISLLSRLGTRVWLSSVVMRSTYKRLPSLVKWAAENGVKGILLSNLIATSEEMESERLYGRAEVDGISEVMRESWFIATASNMKLVTPSFHYRADKWCPFIESGSFAITKDGDVAPCLFALHNYSAWIDGKRVEIKRISFGNLRRNKLNDIWNSESYVSFRSLVKLFQYPTCTDCPAWDGCQISESNEYDCWGNAPSCSFCPYYRGVIQCPYGAVVRGLFS